MGGINLVTSKVLERGLEYDRRWMLVDAKGNFITQRTDARMALFSCVIGNKLKVSFKGDTIEIGIEDHSDKKIIAQVWDSIVTTYEVSNEVSQWFRSKLGFDCHLVKMVDQFERFKELSKGPSMSKVSFADGYPYLFIGTASLSILSSKVGHNVPANRFRANIIVETEVAHEEDSWEQVKLGTATFQMIKPCARCNVINIDQMRAISQKEPLKTLSRYRKEGNKVNFGVNTICLKEGIVSVGDELSFL